MPQQMLKFISVDKDMPEKRKAGERREDFGEIYAQYARDKAAEQASRCSQCGVPFCTVHCPLGNNIPDWLKLTAEGRLQEAYQVSSATNAMPEICGRICPQDRLCEGNCVIEQSGHGTVTIGSVEKYITDTAFAEGWVQPIQPAQEREESVGIIGAGPGGLAAAAALREQGYQVHVYDRYDRVGGLLVYGIPGFKLEKDVVQRRHDLYVASGIHFHLNFEVGKDATLEDLRAKHNTVLIATGVYKPREIMAPGVGLNNVVDALDYLTASNKKGLGDKVPAFEDGSLNADGKKVVVIGGGDTAMDCVRTAVRQGATSVKCLYRRDRENMPGSVREVQNAEEEGVDFVWLTSPKAFVEGGDGNVGAVRAAKMQLGLPDSSGRRTPQELAGSEHDIEADLVIKALGFDPEDAPTLYGAPDLEVSRWGTIKASFSTQMTNLDGVFAVGDIVRGASLVVWAVRDGRDAAQSMHAYMQGKLNADTAIAAE
ncbi:MAG: NAD(P)-dependent oxidoreductase [Alphaproteobacteria bacterium]